MLPSSPYREGRCVALMCRLGISVLLTRVLSHFTLHLQIS